MTLDTAQDAARDTAQDTTGDMRAVYFDGTTSRRRHVELRVGPALEIVEDGAVVATWPLETIRRADGPSGLLRLASVSGNPLARVEIADAATAQTVVKHCTALDRGGPAHVRRIVFWSLAAVCSIVGMAVYAIPLAADRLAPLVPVAMEKRIGEAVDGQVRLLFGGKICVGEDGRAAFKKLVGKLQDASGIALPLEAEVLNTPLRNAVALPGGKVYMLNGLLRRAENADEIAGVLAHEIAHVHHRDGLRRLIQTGGTSFLIGLLFGDVFGGGALIFAAQTMLDASYSRETEQNADAFAAGVMQKLGRSPLPMAQLLLRITKPEGRKGISILNSHPLTEDRLARMKELDRGNTGPELLSEGEWRALKAVCGGKEPSDKPVRDEL
jgi:Zn-dependent protease with chaperone function